MKVQDVMTRHPMCCRLTDTAQRVAQILRDQHIGSMPVVSDGEGKRLEGMITDRDLCCGIVAAGEDPKTTTIAAYVSRKLVRCRPEQSLDSCEKLMQVHQVRRILIVDQEMRCVGIISQADLARSEEGKLHGPGPKYRDLGRRLRYHRPLGNWSWCSQMTSRGKLFSESSLFSATCNPSAGTGRACRVW
jgi:CBS domain-containing protein